MCRWYWMLLLCCLALPGLAVEIIDVPPTVDAQYDLVWTTSAQGPTAAPLLIGVEQDKTGRGYQLRFEKGQVSWEQTGVKTPQPPVRVPLQWEISHLYQFTLKRRADTMALLLDHRLLFCAPAPAISTGSLSFKSAPSGITVDKARYHTVDSLHFGDDFMRPEAQRNLLSNPRGWVEDDTWKVAYYLKDNPGSDPKDPKTGAPLTTPWKLSVFTYTTDTISNGFWFLYYGVGPSWVVANPNMVYASSDRYFVQAAVKTEYNGQVGLIAGYQDNKNYLLFRWKQRDYLPSSAVHAELVQVVDGKEKVLATSQRGFDPEQWYTLRINLGWQVAQVLIDGEELMDTRYTGPVEGRVGLYANGSDSPRRPKVDEITASMYVTTDANTGKVTNEAASAQRTSSLIYFDDVKVGDWVGVQDALNGSGFPVDRTGKWHTAGGASIADAAGRVITGSPAWSRYTMSTRVKLPRNGQTGLFLQMDASGNGYLWQVGAKGQKLLETAGYAGKKTLDQTTIGAEADEWASLRAEVDGPYLTCFLNNRRVLEYYDFGRKKGRCGVLATAGVKFMPVGIELNTEKQKKVVYRTSFTNDKWLVTWSSAEADWYPSFTPRAYVTPAGLPHAMVGNAAPLPTNQPGLYWHKGGHYHDVRVMVPISAATLGDQSIYLTTNYDPNNGYRVVLKKAGDGGSADLYRASTLVGSFPFKLSQKTQLAFERRGGYLLLSDLALDPDPSAIDPQPVSESQVFAWHDPKPLKAEQIGFNVTNAALPAASVDVISDRLVELFEQSPTRWTAQSGVWAIMARYSCQPQWNWFGGFGGGTPTVWSKYRLDGDQTVEAYLGVKMQFDNMPEEYAKRYRDLSVTVCADGEHLDSGYSVIRAGRMGGASTTMLLRKGVVVATSTKPDHLLPPKDEGHRKWFATRIEKRGKIIDVFLDNRLAIHFEDPDPLPGGYAAMWTLNNGLMLGRANLSAEKMTLGSPRAAAPLAVQEDLPPLAPPKVAINNVPVSVSTFENGLDGWTERQGITGRLLRERVSLGGGVANTYLKVVNTYPSGDLSVNAISSLQNLDTTPIVAFDYCFDPGAQVNLYVHRGDTWFEFLLTGTEAAEKNVYTVKRLPAQADNNWHHLEINLGQMIKEALANKFNQPNASLMVNEIVFADWSTSVDLRNYGFGDNVGGTALRFDNFALLPVVKGPVTLTWDAPGSGIGSWKTGLDATPIAVPGSETNNKTLNFTADAKSRYFHLIGKTADGKFGGLVNLALPAGN